MRLDVQIVALGLAQTRNKAQQAIKDGLVTVNRKPVTKAGYEVADTDEIQLADTPETKYVSRSYEKLRHALDTFHVNCKDKVVLDIGASTGGFTQCVLDRNAAYSYACDVGTGQLHSSLRIHPKVENREGVNCRYLKKEDFEKTIDLVVMDVSFISCTKMFEAISAVLLPGKEAIVLIKPQFELGPKELNKHGVVKNLEKKTESLLAMVHDQAKLHHLQVVATTVSSIKGTEGNQEFLAYYKKV
ncbi:MAG: TlyA family RNA methyltransferase [Erysipelotrichaceae bacterium]|nr:TlyA family RNA methyltransferase [Erysipelotrichaceae bacterium]